MKIQRVLANTMQPRRWCKKRGYLSLAPLAKFYRVDKNVTSVFYDAVDLFDQLYSYRFFDYVESNNIRTIEGNPKINVAKKYWLLTRSLRRLFFRVLVFLSRYGQQCPVGISIE